MKTRYYVDWNLDIQSGDEIGRAEKHVALQSGPLFVVVEIDRVFDSEFNACQFALREMTKQYKQITERSNELMNRIERSTRPRQA